MFTNKIYTIEKLIKFMQNSCWKSKICYYRRY